MWMCDARNKVLLASALGGALLFSAAALAAGTYDGTWTGKETTGGCAGTVVTITVANNIASPYMSGTHASSFHGKAIHSDGTVSWISTNTGRHTSITFTGNTFTLDTDVSCGHLSITGSKQ